MNLTIEIAVLGKRYADVRAVDRLPLRVAEGASNGEIARALHISEATVKSHLLHVFAKLGAADRTAAVTVAVQRGLLRLG